MNSSNQILIPSTPVTTLNANYNSTPSVLVDIYGFCVQAIITGTPTGTAKLQASSDTVNRSSGTGVVATPTNWNDIVGSTLTVTSSGVLTWNFNGCFFNFVRLVYTDGSGGTSTATITATINTKGS